MAVAGIPNAAELAKLAGTTHSTARNWTNGTSTPTAYDSVRLAQTLSVSLDWLFRERTEGLEEGRRIRLVAAMNGILPPDITTEPGSEAASAPKAGAAGRARRRVKAASV